MRTALFSCVAGLSLAAMMTLLWINGLLSFLHGAVPKVGAALAFKPNVIPLAVRSPYLSVWKVQGYNEPIFWPGQRMSWGAAVRVDGTTYWFLGDGGSYSTRCTESGFELTSTASIFDYDCGPVDLRATFFSPIETDFTKQSTPFSYFTVQVTSSDGLSHSVQVYSDITGEWVSTDHGRSVNWTTTSTSSLTYHTSTLTAPEVFAESWDSPRWGTVYYTTPSSSSLTHQTGPYVVLRSLFALQGSLYNVADSRYRRIDDQTPGYAFAKDLGTVEGTSEEVVFVVGVIRDPAVRWSLMGGKGEDEYRRLYSFVKWKGDVIAMMEDFVNDLEPARTRAQELDARIRDDATTLVGEEYRRIVELSARQAMATMEITTDNEGENTWVFMKEISSNGDLNTVDVYFPAMPILLYLNPSMLGLILKPHLVYSTSGYYPNKWSVHDLGVYPNAYGHNDGNDEKMPVEECGNMLIMMLSYAAASGDINLLVDYYELLRQWTTFLITDGLIPANQLSTDDFAGPLANQTNLALKAIVAIQSMSKISAIVGDASSSAKYSATAKDYMEKFQTLANSTTEGHLTLSYNNDKTWGLIYNAWPDKLLNLGIVPKKLLDKQTKWYKKVARNFGVQLDTRHEWTKSDWMVWTSAIVTDTDTRDVMLRGLYNFITGNRYERPFPDWYETTDGRHSGFMARPVVGGHFAFLAEKAIANAPGRHLLQMNEEGQIVLPEDEQVSFWTQLSGKQIVFQSEK
ncbi:DUF1793-domain-containing protein [Atractiella rhizophila]|nr:DUF1793-domain-containing protein [Atractiella rhizophila]